MEHTEGTTKRDRGFTLVELLIVIVILGILATVTVFAVRGVTNKGQQNACAADRKTLEVASESYFAQNASTTIPTPAAGTTATGVAYTATPEGELVRVGLLRSESSTYSVSSAGAVSPIAGGACVGL